MAPVRGLNLKKLFGKLTPYADDVARGVSNYGDDALRLASNYGDEALDYGLDIASAVNRYDDDVARAFNSSVDVMKLTPRNEAMSWMYGDPPPIKSTWAPSAEDQDWLTQDLLSRGVLDSNPESYIFDDFEVNPFTNPPTDLIHDDPFEDTFNRIRNTAFTSSEQLNDPSIYSTLTDIDDIISKTSPPDLNEVSWASGPSLDESQRVLRNLYDRLTRNWDMSNPYNERIVSSYLDKLYPYSRDAENEFFKNNFLNKLPRREYGVFE